MSDDDMLLPNRPHDVYWIYDSSDRLLYIGSTHNATERIQTHEDLRCQNPVSNELCHRAVRFEFRRYASRAEARAVERYAIETEAPHLNRQYNTQRFRKQQRGGYLPVGDLPILPGMTQDEIRAGYTPGLLSRIAMAERRAA